MDRIPITSKRPYLVRDVFWDGRERLSLCNRDECKIVYF
jgi:hypothetical protein